MGRGRTVRATSLAFVLWAVLVGGACAGERTVTPPPAARATTEFPVASDVRLAGDETQTRFVVDFTRKVDFRAFALANPYRVVIDLPQVTFQLPPKAGEVGRGLIKAFRFGLIMQGGSRIVIDLARPARLEKTFTIDAANGQPDRLVLELAATEGDAFLRTVALENRTPEPRRSIAVHMMSGETRLVKGNGHDNEKIFGGKDGELYRGPRFPRLWPA